MANPPDIRKPRAPFTAAVIIALAAFALYLPSLDGQFVFDDPVYVVHNPHLRPFTAGTLAWAVTGSHQANWHPITWVSHAVDLAVFGDKPAGHHAVNMALHAANSALLCLWVFLVTRSRWASVAVAALFAVHPLHVESVAWISERKTLLCTLFTLATLSAYAAYASRPTVVRYLLVFLALAAALACKQMAVTVPFVLLLLDYWPLRRLSLRSVAEKLPLLLLSAGASWMAWSTQHSARAVTPLNIIGWGLRLPNIVVSFARYVANMVVPIRLSPFYPFPGMEAPPWPGWRVAVSLLLVVGISAIALIQLRRRPYLAVGWLWFLGMLTPVIGLVQIGLQAMADRFAYLPSIGFLLAGVGLMSRRRTGEGESAPPSAGSPAPTGEPGLAPPRWPIGVLAGAAVALLAMATVRQIGVWQDNEAMWRRALLYAPGSAYARHGVAEALIHKHGNRRPGEVVASGQWFIDARWCLEEAVPLERDLFRNTRLRVDLADLYVRGELYSLAIHELEQITQQAPDDAVYRGRLAYVQEKAARALPPGAERSELQEAARANYLWALGLRATPEKMAEIHGRYASFLVWVGLPDDGIAEFRRAIALYPTPQLYHALASALDYVGRKDEAEEIRRQAREKFAAQSAGT